MLFILPFGTANLTQTVLMLCKQKKLNIMYGIVFVLTVEHKMESFDNCYNVIRRVFYVRPIML